MKKLKVFGLLALVLAIGLIFAGCAGEEPDTWTAATSNSQINGTWKGSRSETHTYKEWFAKWEQTWTDYTEALYGNMSMVQKSDTVWVINTAAKTLTRTYKNVNTFSGGKIDTAWAVMKAGWTNNPPEFNDSNHSYSWTNNYGPETINDNFYRSFWVNQSGKKIRLQYNDGTELILTKQ